MNKSKITHKQFIYSDFDKDKIKNIDDRYPYLKEKRGQKHSINPELTLSDELKALEEIHKSKTEVYKRLKREIPHDKGRVKHPISVMRKLRTRYSEELTDYIGTTIYAKDRNDVHSIAREIKDNHQVIEDENYYSQPKGEARYRARHLLVNFEGNIAEIQIKTKKMARLHEEGHLAYKMGDLKKQREIGIISDKLAEEGY